MSAKTQIELLREVVQQNRKLKEDRKALNEDKKAQESKVDQLITNEGPVVEIKKEWIKVENFIEKRKTLNAKIKRAANAVEQIIMGEGQYDNAQMTIFDYIENGTEVIEEEE